MAYRSINPYALEEVASFPLMDEGAIEAVLAELPFGGVKNSGFGRELSELGIGEFVNRKLVTVQ